MTTNITPEHKRALDWIIECPDTVALFSCFVDGKPTAAICYVHEDHDGGINIQPLFIVPTADMVLTDHEGNAVHIGYHETVTQKEQTK